MPLVDLCEDNGPTEFFPTTHRCSAGRRQTAIAHLRSKHSPSPTQAGKKGEREHGGAGVEGLTFDAAAGGAILFDYRILHRGLGNRSTADRPMLYFTYGRQWFKDSTNYPSLSLFE